MSFINTEKNRAAGAGWFLESETGAVLKTREVKQTDGVDSPNGGKYVKAGTVYPSNDSSAEGIVYEDVDVTNGDMPASVVVAGRVYEDRLPVALDSAAKTALEGKGFVFVATAPAVERPY